uniref:Peptidase M12B propeptide domain-containing protein n=1 Tax=Timema genevievae TaxID=629358 RepID=A0A7R9JWS8_TIMGE|nr:unnamed protein product [Timema genevievae]
MDHDRMDTRPAAGMILINDRGEVRVREKRWSRLLATLERCSPPLPAQEPTTYEHGPKTNISAHVKIKDGDIMSSGPTRARSSTILVSSCPTHSSVPARYYHPLTLVLLDPGGDNHPGGRVSKSRKLSIDGEDDPSAQWGKHQVEYVKPVKISPLPLHEQDLLYGSDQWTSNGAGTSDRGTDTATRIPPLRHHSGHFRHKMAELWDPHPQYEFTAFGRQLHLLLERDSSFVAPDLQVTDRNVCSSTNTRFLRCICGILLLRGSHGFQELVGRKYLPCEERAEFLDLFTSSHGVMVRASLHTLTDYTMTLSYKLHHSGTKQGSSLTLTDYTMTLSYKLHHSGTKQGSSLTLTDYTMTLSYKLHHSGTQQGSSLTMTDYTMTLSYKLHHSGTKQGSSPTLTDYTMTLSYKLHHSGTKQGSSPTLILSAIYRATTVPQPVEALYTYIVTHVWHNFTTREHPGLKPDGCFYRGRVKGDSQSTVAVNLCHGMILKFEEPFTKQLTVYADLCDKITRGITMEKSEEGRLALRRRRFNLAKRCFIRINFGCSV